jgi:hypothetical protein
MVGGGSNFDRKRSLGTTVQRGGGGCHRGRRGDGRCPNPRKNRRRGQGDVTDDWADHVLN